MSSENEKEIEEYFQKIEWDKEDLEHAKILIEKINYLSKNEFTSKDFYGLEEFEYFLANNNKILIPTFGVYSSGKSSLLNLLIGEDYLPTANGVCTNKGVIIQYTSRKDIAELYEIKLKLGSKYFTFGEDEEDSKKICGDKTKIKSEIDKINKKNKSIKLEDSFILLKVYVKFFELFDEEIKQKILLIDFPGIGVLNNKNFFSSDVLGSLINQSDSFLFFNPEVIDCNENQIIITEIVEKIKNRKISFSYKNCLFILNKWDIHRYKDNYNYSIEKAKEDLQSIFNKNNLMDIFPKIEIINCSAYDYQNFLSLKNSLLNFEEYFLNLIENFEQEYELSEHKENEDKNKKLYEYLYKDILDIFEDLTDTQTKANDYINESEYVEKLDNLLKQRDHELLENELKEIVLIYLKTLKNIDNHKLLKYSNEQELKKTIKSHIELSISNMKINIEEKGINFIKKINRTLNYILKRLDKPYEKKNLKFSKIEQSKMTEKKIKEIFFRFKKKSRNQFDEYISKQDNFINDYINNINNIFDNKKKENANISNKIILGKIENEKLDEIKNDKKIFYNEMKEGFKKFIDIVNSKIKSIEMDIDMDEKNFQQVYFETSEVGINKTNKSIYWRFIVGMLNMFKMTSWSEYYYHKKILYDDKETLIKNSIDNFNLVKKQNREILNDFISAFKEKLEEFENNVNKEVQKMIDLSYSDYTIFIDDSKKIINESMNEFNEYIKNKVNRKKNFS